VAARHGVYPGLLFTWRRQVRDGLLVAPPPATFVPVRMLPSEVAAEPEVRQDVPGRHDAQASGSRRPDVIEITLVNGCRLLVDQHVEARALRRIVGVLRG
jgi:transposase